MKNLYLTNRFYFILVTIAVLFVTGHFIHSFYVIAKFAVIAFSALFLIDFLMIYNFSKQKITASRKTPDRLSNGDENRINIDIQNFYAFPVSLEIIDEIPVQFQIRNFLLRLTLKSNENKTIAYTLKPNKRGEYFFGSLNIYVSNRIGLVNRRFRFDKNAMLPVYPSFIQMRKYELMAISNRLVEMGIKKIRRISNNQEFEQIKEYVKGDDFRTINWKATARRTKLMTNQYQDEKSQQVYSIIDMGRTMKMPFEGMTLLDYAINTSLVISNIAMLKQDKAGLITFSKNIHSVLPAGRRNNQIISILDILYKQTTNFEESNFEMLYATIKRTVHQRSLLMIYTNFEAIHSLHRQLKHFVNLAQNHLLVIVFFENTEIKKLTKQKPESIEDIYIKTIAEKFVYEKKQVVKELIRHGIHTILTEPQNLTINSLNKYLELKARGLI